MCAAGRAVWSRRRAAADMLGRGLSLHALAVGSSRVGGGGVGAAHSPAQSGAHSYHVRTMYYIGPIYDAYHFFQCRQRRAPSNGASGAYIALRSPILDRLGDLSGRMPPLRLPTCLHRGVRSKRLVRAFCPPGMLTSPIGDVSSYYAPRKRSSCLPPSRTHELVSVLHCLHCLHQVE